MNSIKIIGIVLILMFSIYGCKSVELAGYKAQNPIQIDGSAGEWEGKLQYNDDAKAAIGVQNDDQNIYFCIKTRERAVKQKIMMAGLTIWFDNKGSDDKRFGIRFPLGLQTLKEDRPELGNELQNASELKDPSGMGGPDQGGRMDMIPNRFPGMYRELEIAGPGKTDLNRIETVTAKNDYGIEAAIKDTEGVMTYELKVPFKARKFSYAVGTIEAGILGLGLETGEFKMPEKIKGGSDKGGRRSKADDGGMTADEGGGPGGEGGGMRGGRGGSGGPGGHQRGDNKSMSEQVKLWAKVKIK